MKIAILGIKGVPGLHGVEVVVDSLLPCLSAYGHDITVYGYSKYTQNMADYRGAQVKTVSGVSLSSLEMISHMWKATSDAKKGSYDIVHIHSTDPCLLAWKAKARYGIIATSHGQAYLRKKWGVIPRAMSQLAERFFIHLPAKCTSVSKSLADYYYKKYDKDVVYIPNGIHIRAVPDNSYLEKIKLQSRRFLFCSAGRVDRTKGIHTLLEAYAKLDTGLPLIIAGGGSGSDPRYLDELKRNKPDNVFFPGFLSGEAYYSLCAHARVFIFPSEYEAMSMTLLEGLSFGTPVVYSNIPENEAVAKGIGTPFKVADADHLAHQLQGVLDNYDYALKTGNRAVEVVTKNHDWRVIAGRYNEIYEEMRRNALYCES